MQRTSLVAVVVADDTKRGSY